MVLCKNCKHFDSQFVECNHPQFYKIEYSPVNGARKSLNMEVYTKLSKENPDNPCSSICYLQNKDCNCSLYEPNIIVKIVNYIYKLF